MVLNLAANHKPGETAVNPRAPMPAGPIVCRADGRIDWGNMWDSFCPLATCHLPLAYLPLAYLPLATCHLIDMPL
jgi:hypothetical protein